MTISITYQLAERLEELTRRVEALEQASYEKVRRQENADLRARYKRYAEKYLDFRDANGFKPPYGMKTAHFYGFFAAWAEANKLAIKNSRSAAVNLTNAVNERYGLEVRPSTKRFSGNESE